MITMIAVVLQVAATAAQVSVADGEEITVPVPPTGVTLQMPGVVQVVTPSGDYVVKPLGAARAPAARTPSGGAAAAPQAESGDVRLLLVRPGKPSASEQSVTFVLGDNRSVSARLVSGTARDDSFINVRWAKRLAAGLSSRGGEQFLAAERALLLAMLRDAPGFGRKTVEQKVELPGYPALEVLLKRTYEAEGLYGAVYAFTNRSDKAVVVNPTVLAIGKPNRAVLTQMDHEELRPCAEDQSPDPRGTGCTSLVRVVARRERQAVNGVGRGDAMPFVLTPVEKERQ